MQSTATVTKEKRIGTKKLRKIVKVDKISTLRNGREGTKTATEYELRLQHCGPLTTWGLILVLLVIRRACVVTEWI